METIKTLIDKYFDGETSCHEEHLLMEYFSQEDVSKSLSEYRSYFWALKQLQNKQKKELITWGKRGKDRFLFVRHSIFTAVASVAIVVFIITLFYKNYHDGYVLINGVKYKDKKNMEASFNKSIQNVKMDMDDFWSILND